MATADREIAAMASQHGVTGTARGIRAHGQLVAFARDVQQRAWSRFHHVMNKHGLHPGRTDDDLIEILDRALIDRGQAAQPAAQAEPQRCQQCIDRQDGFYGSYAPPCPTHDDDGKPRATPPAPTEQLQSRVQPWLMACFGPEIASDRKERNHRFLEEALELVQACGCTASEAHQLVDYTFGRPVGEASQEVGGVMITLAALCLANGLDMHAAGEVELARIWTKVEAIRAKQEAKPKHSPLPAHPTALPSQDAARLDFLDAFLRQSGGGVSLSGAGPVRQIIDAARAAHAQAQGGAA